MITIAERTVLPLAIEGRLGGNHVMRHQARGETGPYQEYMISCVSKLIKEFFQKYTTCTTCATCTIWGFNTYQDHALLNKVSDQLNR